MKVIGIQNCINTTPTRHNDKTRYFADTSQRKQVNQWNPGYYMPVFTSSTTDKFTALFNKGLETELTQPELTQLADYLYEIKDDVTYDPDSYIGEGNFGYVYKMNDDYVLKIQNSFSYLGGIDKKFEYTKDRKFSDIPYYYGEVLAKCDNMEILKNANPKGDAIVCGMPVWLDEEEQKRYLIDVSLPAFAKLPQSAYDNYAKVLKSLNEKTFTVNEEEKKYSPDILNNNNFMIVDDEIRFVDEMDTLDSGKENDLYTMLASFFDWGMKFVAPELPETTKNKKEIFKKCVLASEEAELPIPTDGWRILSLSSIMDLCDYDTDEQEFIDNLTEIRTQEPDKELRKQKLSDYLDNLE